MGISIFSYNGDVIVGFATDELMVPEPNEIIQAFQQEFEYLMQWGRPAGNCEQAVTQPESEEVLCQALTKAGKPCKNRAGPDSAYCRVHQSWEATPPDQQDE